MNDIDNLREACRGYPRAAIVSAIEAAIIAHEQRTRGCRETATLIAVWLTDPGVAARSAAALIRLGERHSARASPSRSLNHVASR